MKFFKDKMLVLLGIILLLIPTINTIKYTITGVYGRFSLIHLTNIFLNPFALLGIIFILIYIIKSIKPKHKTPWIVLLILGLIPIILFLLICVNTSISGFCFMDCSSSTYGINAFISTFILLSLFYGSFLVIAVFFTIISIIKLKELKKRS